MSSLVRFDHSGRRREIVDSLPVPRVSLRVSREGDGLRAARGILLGILISITLWTAILLAWFTWN